MTSPVQIDWSKAGSLTDKWKPLVDKMWDKWTTAENITKLLTENMSSYVATKPASATHQSIIDSILSIQPMTGPFSWTELEKEKGKKLVQGYLFDVG